MSIREKTVAFVPVRLTSSRLPAKHLKNIGDRTLIEWVLKRLKECREVDDIVICCPDEPSSRNLKPVAEANDVHLFIYEGDSEDVVGRLTAAAKIFEADICVLASGDCPLLNPATIDAMTSALRGDPEAAHVRFEPADGVWPIHEGIVISRRRLWELAERHSDTPELREHHFPVFLRNLRPDVFSGVKTLSFSDDALYYSVRQRISVDTSSDLEFMNGVYAALAGEGREFNLNNVLRLLAEKPELKEINASIVQKDLHHRTKRVMFYIPSSDNNGYFSLLRACEVADALVKGHSVGAGFVVSDDGAARVLSEKGFRVAVGGLDNLRRNDALKGYDAVVVDVSVSYPLESDFTEKIKSAADVRVISVCESPGMGGVFMESDLLIVPSFHWSGGARRAVRYGKDYVVVRGEIKNVKPLSAKKKQSLVVYTPSSRYSEILTEKVKKVRLGFKLDLHKSLDGDFPNALAGAKLIITTLGGWVYEALYLDTITILLAMDVKEQSGIEIFNRNARDIKPSELENGAANIAREIAGIL
jgi:spore coat polysaccharide biosynthesis protein SpsF